MSLVDRVQAFARRHDLWTPETRVVAAVSGGSDSVALLLILDALARDGLLRVAGVAHLHHHIRGADADADAAFVRALAARLGLPFHRGDADVPARASAGGGSVELAGREARLEFFQEALGRLQAGVVALAHTRGDQAETVLMRLVRGAGPRGLGGMAPRTDHRVRPLLDVGRGDLRTWLRDRGERWRDDATNDDVIVARNWIRHEVLPRLAALNPQVERALARAARIHAADAAVLDRLAGVEAERLIDRHGAGVWLNLDEVTRLPEALARRVVLRALETSDPSRAYGWEETDALLEPAPEGEARDLGTLRLERIRGFAVLTSKGSLALRRPSTSADEVVLTLEVPGSVRHPGGHWMVEASGPMPRELAGEPSVDRAVLDAAAIGRRLTVRGWRPGDRVQPLGLGGRRKKLQDVFVNRKVPRDERALVPVVVDGQERVAWVAGHVVGEPFRLTPHSATVVVLTLRR